MLNNHKTLFSGGLGKVDMKPINIKLKKGCKPHGSRHYSEFLMLTAHGLPLPFANPKRICQLDF